MIKHHLSKSYHEVTLILLLTLCVFFIPDITQAAQVNFTWNANPVGDNIDKGGYKLYFGKKESCNANSLCEFTVNSSTKGSSPIDIPADTIDLQNPGYVLDGLDEGSWCFYLTAYNNIGESGPTATLTKVIDKTNPLISITKPTITDTYTTTTSNIDISGTASDNVCLESITWANDKEETGTVAGTTNWSITNLSLYEGENIITLIAIDSSTNTSTDTLIITYSTWSSDTTPPTTEEHRPVAGTLSVPISTNIVVHIKDSGDGVDRSTIIMMVEGIAVTPTISGTPADYTLTYDRPVDFGYMQVVNVTIDVSDLAGNPMNQDAFSFTTIARPDIEDPVISITSPAGSGTYYTNSSRLSIAGTASDNVELVGITWENDRGGRGTASGTTNWTATNINLYEGNNIITVTATDTSERVSTDEQIVTFTLPPGTYTEEFGEATNTNHPGTCMDTYINAGSYANINYSSDAYLNTYTYPTDTSANRVIMNWDLSAVSSSATVQNAILHLFLNGMEAGGGDDAYEISAHKIINNNPDINTCTWNTYNGINSWTGGDNGAIRDMSSAIDSQTVDKTTGGYKTWIITGMVADWVANPSENFSMILESDNTAASNSNRYFSSTDNPNADQRPKLIISYSLESSDTTPPQGTITINNGESFTNSTSVALTISTTDSDGSGVVGWLVSETQATPPLPGDAGWLTVSPTVYTLSNGDRQKTLYAWFKDGADNVSSAPATYEIMLDTTPPEGSIHIELVPNTIP